MDISEDAKAVLLIYGEFGKANGCEVNPLTLKEYNRLTEWLEKNGCTPGDLITGEALKWLDFDPDPPVERGRLERLLNRGPSLAFAVENWTNKGIWIVCRHDKHYPKRWVVSPAIWAERRHRFYTGLGLRPWPIRVGWPWWDLEMWIGPARILPLKQRPGPLDKKRLSFPVGLAALT